MGIKNVLNHEVVAESCHTLPTTETSLTALKKFFKYPDWPLLNRRNLHSPRQIARQIFPDFFGDEYFNTLIGVFPFQIPG